MLRWEGGVPEYRGYVIELKRSLWKKSGRFRRKNSEYQPGKPLVYVGSTGKTVEERLQDHLAGRDTENRYVTRYYKRLVPPEYEGIRPRQSRGAVERREARKAEELRGRGSGVWQG